MKTYIALLRGINVSGHKIIKMELLRKVLAELDFTAISTYIQSGNIIFKSGETNVLKLEKQIASKIEAHFGFDVPVVIISLDELIAVADKNPYAAFTEKDPTLPYVAFLSGLPEMTAVANLKAVDFGKDEFINENKTLYLLYDNFTGNSKLSNSTIESKLKVRATSRNWKTVLKLIELAQNLK